MPLELGTTSSRTVDAGLLQFDEQYTLRWIDRTEPKEEPKYDEPDKMQVRMRCEFEIVSQPDGLTHPDTGADIDLRGERVADFFTVSLHEKSNLGQFVRAMLGMKADEEFVDPKYDIDQLCASKNAAGNGGTFRATIRRKENGYPKIVMPLPVRGAKNLNKPVAPVTAPGNEPPF